MIPIKPSKIYEDISKEKNIPLDHISNINKFYWNRVKSVMTNLEQPSVYITGLGRFTIKQAKIFNEIAIMSDKKEYWKKKNINSPQYIVYDIMYKKLSKLGNILKEEWDRKKQIKSERKQTREK